jgi:hypothetical protein
MKSKLVFKIWQIYYDDESKRGLDGGFIPYNNTGVQSKAFENDIILNVWIDKKKEWINADYVGILSWRVFEKTKLKSTEIFKKISEKNEMVYSINIPKYKSNKHPYTRNGYPSVRILAEMVDKSGIFDFKLKNYPIKKPIWCNYWITTPEIFDLYCCNYLNKVMTLFQRTKDKDILKALEMTEPHRYGKHYPSLTFFLEGLFSVFLEEEKIKYFEII